MFVTSTSDVAAPSIADLRFMIDDHLWNSIYVLAQLAGTGEARTSAARCRETSCCRSAGATLLPVAELGPVAPLVVGPLILGLHDRPTRAAAPDVFGMRY
jgi:hypothetical protein